MKITENSARGISTILVVVVALVLAVVFFKSVKKIFDSIMETLGLKDSKEETENKELIDTSVNHENSLGVNSAWSPQYYRNKPNSKIFTQAKTDALVNQLWDSVGYFYDTPSKADGAIKQCSTKSQVSWLASNFQNKHSAGLLNWMENHFDDGEEREYLAGILRYVANLPSGLS
jgi:hypothetical protein